MGREGGVPDGRQARWTRHSTARRQVIIDAAIAVLEESAQPEFQVQQIAERAGINRTVIYRYFDDRADLDHAVQAHALDDLRARLLPVIALEGTPREIIRRIVGTYIHWAVAHPVLHEFVHRRPTGVEVSEMEAAIQQVAERVEGLLQAAVSLLDVGFADEQQAAVDPLVFGLVGGVVTAVRRWMNRPARKPDVETFIDTVTVVVWQQISGMAELGGVRIDPDLPVDQLFGTVAGAAG